MNKDQPQPGTRFNRREAADCLKEHWGVKVAPATLAKYATVGGGPEYEKFGRFPVYSPAGLDDYARRKLSAPMASTSAAA